MLVRGAYRCQADGVTKHCMRDVIILPSGTRIRQERHTTKHVKGKNYPCFPLQVQRGRDAWSTWRRIRWEKKRLVKVRCRPTYAGQVRVRGVTNPPLFTMQLTLLR